VSTRKEQIWLRTALAYLKLCEAETDGHVPPYWGEIKRLICMAAGPQTLPDDIGQVVSLNTVTSSKKLKRGQRPPQKGGKNA